jgi:hypothetical protein
VHPKQQKHVAEERKLLIVIKKSMYEFQKKKKTQKIITKYECRVKYLPTAGANPTV